MKRHEQLAEKAAKLRTLAAFLSIFSMICGAIAVNAIKYEITTMYLPTIIGTCVCLSMAVCAWMAGHDAQRDADMARYFDREDWPKL